MRIPDLNVIDFETGKIEPRPDYPPIPVGVSIKEMGKRAKYLAWGHPNGNNTTLQDAKRILKQVWVSGKPLLFHNAKFDIDVGEVHMDMPVLSWHKIHDTEFLAFLHNPHDNSLSLKPLTEKYLNMPPDEQDELHDWILSYVFTSEKGGQGKVIVADKKPISYHKIPPTKAGAFISYSPGKLCAKYANSDTDRTYKLFKFLYSYIIENGMSEAYDRERRLLRPLLKSEKKGIYTDKKRLKTDMEKWEESVDLADQWIRKRLKSKDLNVDEKNNLADAIENAGKVDEWVLTEKGNRSVAKDNIVQCVTDESLINVLNYRGLLINSLRNFGRSWLSMAESTDGIIHTNWNQVRKTNERGNHSSGARTGRLSSNPNFQNISKNPKIIKLPKWLKDRVVSLPALRGYIKPRPGYVLINRDYSQQELRILGHYEDGVLLNAYHDNPALDMHVHARSLVNEFLGADFEKGPIKTMGFGLIYGMGLKKLAKEMGVDYSTAKVLKKTYLRLFPGLKQLMENLQDIGNAGEYITTWGGRQYYVQPKTWDRDKKRWKTYEYKLLNQLIQGSAADCTKEAIIRIDDVMDESTNLLLTVHDEIMLEALRKMYKQEMKKMKQAMESIEFDVFMRSTGKYSLTSWAELKECD